MVLFNAFIEFSVIHFPKELDVVTVTDVNRVYIYYAQNMYFVLNFIHLLVLNGITTASITFN